MKRITILILLSIILLVSCSNQTTQKRKPVDGWPNKPSAKLKAEFLGRAFPANTTNILKNSRQFYLLSLDPLSSMHGDSKAKNSFHGYKILGKTRIKNRKLKTSLLTAFQQDVAKSAHPRNGISPAKACFVPRHGIQAMESNRFVDIVICFECSQFQLYTNGKEGGSTVLGASEKLFNQTLRQAGVPVPSE